MLSISARGSATNALAYYEHLQTERRAGELEDYYAREHQGRYLGSGVHVLGLSNVVDRKEFESLATGRTPLGNAQGAGENHRSGWDLTFSCPKSVSILWALGGEALHAAIEGAHERAVIHAISFLEDHAAFTRRGSGVHSDLARREQVGLVVASYLHGTSRELDPQLHSHCFTFNVSPRADGTVGALDSRPLYEWRMACGSVYRAELAEELQRLGYAVERDGRSFRVAGVPQALEDEFSTRRKQIKQALAERGASGAKAAEIAALSTRRAKKGFNREMLHATWSQRAQDRVPEWKPEHAVRSLMECPLHQAFDVRALQTEITREHSTVSAAQLYAAVAIDQQLAGGREHIERAASTVALDVNTVRLTAHGETRYTTRDMVAVEESMMSRAVRMTHLKNHAVDRKKVGAAISSRPELSQEQCLMIEHITMGGDLACVQGHAGTGKSFALTAARAIWEAEGYRIRGAAVAGKAAQQLQSASGIEATTLRRLEMDMCDWTDERGVQHTARSPLRNRDILVLDEAGMAGSRQIAGLLENVERAHAKLVLVGDTKQLQPIDAGAAFRAIQEHTGYVEISNIRRQRSAEDRKAVRDLAEGRAEQALNNLSSRGRIHGYPRALDAKQAAGQAVIEDIEQGKSSIALTATRAEARDINEHAREAARERGMLLGEDVAVLTRAGERNLAVGDRILFMRNNRGLDVKNGDLGTVRVADVVHGKVRIDIELDSGIVHTVDLSKYDHLEYGYAVTAHKAQGSTVDRSHVYAGENGLSYREWAYVAGSRHREEVHIYADKATIAELAPEWSRSRQKDVTLDYQPMRELQQEDKQHVHAAEVTR
ncbi:MAG: MobF family relaxase [Gammaproteobacteria bacterium]